VFVFAECPNRLAARLTPFETILMIFLTGVTKGVTRVVHAVLLLNGGLAASR
jgi:hypothetical protein